MSGPEALKVKLDSLERRYSIAEEEEGSGAKSRQTSSCLSGAS